MALAIRLARGGAKKRPELSDGRFWRTRATASISSGSAPTTRCFQGFGRAHHAQQRARRTLARRRCPTLDRVARFLDAAGLMKREARNNPQKGAMGDKAKERIEERAKRATEAAEAAAVAAAAPAAEEVPAEEVPIEEVAAAEVPAAEAPVEEVAAEEAPAAETSVEVAPEPVAAELDQAVAAEAPAAESVEAVAPNPRRGWSKSPRQSPRKPLPNRLLPTKRLLPRKWPPKPPPSTKLLLPRPRPRRAPRRPSSTRHDHPPRHACRHRRRARRDRRGAFEALRRKPRQPEALQEL